MRLMAGILVLAIGVAPCAFAADPRVCFTPGEDCTSVIVSEIAAAKREVLVQAYNFSSPPIIKALLEAKRRGVDVRAVLDRSNRTANYSGADAIANGGIPTLIDSAHKISHNKLMIIDQRTVVGGSFNYTTSAQEKNAENVTVFSDPVFAAKFMANWHTHAMHSEPFASRADRR